MSYFDYTDMSVGLPTPTLLARVSVQSSTGKPRVLTRVSFPRENLSEVS